KGQVVWEVSSGGLLGDAAGGRLREIVERLGQGLAEPLHLGEEQGVRLVAPHALLEKGSDLGPDVLRLAAALVGLLLERGLELVVLMDDALELPLELGKPRGRVPERTDVRVELGQAGDGVAQRGLLALELRELRERVPHNPELALERRQAVPEAGELRQGALVSADLVRQRAQ